MLVLDTANRGERARVGGGGKWIGTPLSGKVGVYKDKVGQGRCWSVVLDIDAVQFSCLVLSGARKKPDTEPEQSFTEVTIESMPCCF